MNRFDPGYWNLLWELTRADFKVRDQSTTLGFLWTLLHPAFEFMILYLLFTRWIGAKVDNYAAFLILGLVPFRFFQKATSYGLTALRRRAALARNFKFPKEILVLSAVGSELWVFLLEFAALLPFLLFIGVRPTAGWALVPFVLGVEILLVISTALIMSLIVLRFEDAERIWSIAMTLGFYVTPVFYPLAILSEERRALLHWNPLAVLVEAFRESLMRGWSHDWIGLSAVGAAAVALFAFSLWTFRRDPAWIADRMVEQ